MPRAMLIGLIFGCFAASGCGRSDDVSSRSTGAASHSENEEAAREAKGRAAFARLVEAHREGQPDAWTEADAELTELGTAALPALVDGLKSRSRDERELASAGMAKLGAEALAAEDALMAALDDESEVVRVNVTSVLSLQTSPDSSEQQTQPLLAALLKLLDSENANTRQAAAVTLSNLGPQAAPAVPRLAEALKDGNANVRKAAAETLGRLGSAAKEAIGPLEALAADEEADGATRTAASEALERLRGATSKQ